MRLLYLVSHPIQYQAPLLRRVAATPGIELHVLFESLDTAGTYFDDGFGTDVAWDVPLTDGYAHGHARTIADVDTHLSGADALWVHGWDSTLRRRALEIARRSGIPVLMRGENTLAAMPDGAGLRGVLKRTYLRWIFYRCAGFLCIGTDNREYYSAHGVDGGRLFDMPYAVDNEFFEHASARAAANRQTFRDDLGLDAAGPVVLFAGKLQARKAPGALLDALALWPGERPYLLYVGDGDQRRELEDRAAGDDTVRFLGFRNQQELPAFYDLADVFVLPSTDEPWGLAINEAMASGTAVIATDHCGCARDLIDDSCGAIVPYGDTTRLYNALSDILSSPTRAATMGERARQRIRQWSFKEDIDGLLLALNAVTSSPRQS